MLSKITLLLTVTFMSKYYPKYKEGEYRITKYYFLGILIFKAMEMVEDNNGIS